MPTYEYVCKACAHAFERFESISAAPDKSCPACGKKKAERQISMGGGLIFKGSGFYTTDYRGSGYADAAKKENEGSKPASSESKTTATDTGTKAETPKSAAEASKPAAVESKPAKATKSGKKKT